LEIESQLGDREKGGRPGLEVRVEGAVDDPVNERQLCSTKLLELA